MTKDEARQLLVDVASTDLNKVEVTRNRAPWIEKLWPCTTYPDGMKQREPYCAAGMCWVLKEWIARLSALGELKKTTGMTGAQAEKWRCKSARAFGWQDWAKAKGLTILPDTAKSVPKGAFMVFDMSHIGIVDTDLGSRIVTAAEYNTGATGGRDGDGCFSKTRDKALAKCFIVVI
jgi:hypothetical protein